MGLEKSSAITTGSPPADTSVSDNITHPAGVKWQGHTISLPSQDPSQALMVTKKPLTPRATYPRITKRKISSPEEPVTPLLNKLKTDNGQAVSTAKGIIHSNSPAWAQAIKTLPTQQFFPEGFNEKARIPAIAELMGTLYSGKTADDVDGIVSRINSSADIASDFAKDHAENLKNQHGFLPSRDFTDTLRFAVPRIKMIKQQPEASNQECQKTLQQTALFLYDSTIDTMASWANTYSKQHKENPDCKKTADHLLDAGKYLKPRHCNISGTAPMEGITRSLVTHYAHLVDQFVAGKDVSSEAEEFAKTLGNLEEVEKSTNAFTAHVNKKRQQSLTDLQNIQQKKQQFFIDATDSQAHPSLNKKMEGFIKVLDFVSKAYPGKTAIKEADRLIALVPSEIEADIASKQLPKSPPSAG